MVPELDRLRADLHGISADRYVLVDGDRSRLRSSIASSSTLPVPSAPAAVIDRDDPFNIIYSSGTTGLPKGIVHTHAIREAYCTGFASSFRIHPESVVLHSGSLVFNGAFLTLMPAFYLGCTYVLMPRFDPDRLIELVERERVTHTMLVPSQLIALLERPGFGEERCGSLEMICSVGAPLHLGHKQELERRLPGRFYELYGLTEGFATVLDRDDAGAQARLGRGAAAPVRDADRRRERRRSAGGRDRRDRGPRPDHDARLLQAARPHRGDDQGGVDPHGRSRSRRRGRVPLPRRPQEGPDHLGRRQRLPARHRGGRGPPSGRRRGRRLRRRPTPSGARRPSPR